MRRWWSRFSCFQDGCYFCSVLQVVSCIVSSPACSCASLTVLVIEPGVLSFSFLLSLLWPLWFTIVFQRLFFFPLLALASGEAGWGASCSPPAYRFLLFLILVIGLFICSRLLLFWRKTRLQLSRGVLGLLMLGWFGRGCIMCCVQLRLFAITYYYRLWVGWCCR